MTSEKKKCDEFKTLEQFLEPSPLVAQLEPISKKMAEYVQMLQNVDAMEKGSLGLVQNVKDPKSHNPGGIMGLYKALQAYNKDLDKLKETIPSKGYEIVVDGERTVVTPANTLDMYAGRAKWAEYALGCLFKIYRPEIQKAIEAQKATMDEMNTKFDC